MRHFIGSSCVMQVCNQDDKYQLHILIVYAVVVIVGESSQCRVGQFWHSWS